MNDDEFADETRALQAAIYRDKVMRARGMTNEERFAEVLELSDGVYEAMHAAAMAQCGCADEEAGWVEVARRLARVRRVQERGLYQVVPV